MIIVEARESQYVDDYLASNGARGHGKGLTIGSYLAYQLRGSARDYAGKYAVALRNACDKRVQARLAYQGRSRLGGSAYYPGASRDAEVARKAVDMLLTQDVAPPPKADLGSPNYGGGMMAQPDQSLNN